MAIDPANGNLFVTDFARNHVRVYSVTGAAGQLLTTFGDVTEISQPVGIAIDSDGDIYVAAAGNSGVNRLVRYSQNTALDPDDPDRYERDPGFSLALLSSAQIGAVGPAAAPLGAPAAGGIALDPNPNPGTGKSDVMVLDTGNNRVHRINSDGAAVAACVQTPPFPATSWFNGAASGTGFAGVRDISVGPGGDIYVADSQDGSVRVTRWSAACSFVANQAGGPTVTSASGMALAVEPSTGELLASAASTPNSAHMAQFENNSFVTQTELTGAQGNVFAVAADGQEPRGAYVLAGTTGFSPVAGAMNIYVLNSLGLIPEFPAVTIDSVDQSEVDDSSAVLRGTVNPQGGSARWRFEYRRTDLDPLPAWTEMPLSPVGEELTGTDPQAVSATATGLEPATPYEVRLFADNGFGRTARSDAPHPEFETAPVSPVAMTGTAWSVSANQATLAGTVNPKNANTSYYFEYGPEDNYGLSVPVPAVDAGDGGSPVLVTADVNGLEPGTSYHFRLVAQNTEHPDQDLVDAGEDREFQTRTEAEAALPERGYELVSVADTNGITANPIFSSPEGNHFLYWSLIPTPGSENGGLTWTRTNRKSDGSWERDPFNHDFPVDPDLPGLGSANAPGGVSSDLSHILRATNGTYDQADNDPGGDVYLRNSIEGSTRLISRTELPPTGSVSPIPRYLSADGGVAVFNSNRPLLAEHGSGDGRLYRADTASGRLDLVSIRPGDSTGVQGQLGAGSSNDGVVRNAVSADGNRIAWQANSGGLYIYRQDAAPLSVSDVAGAKFWGADTGLSNVVFSIGGNLFARDVDAGSEQRIASAESGDSGLTGVLHVADDANRVYFLASKDLTGGNGPQIGMPNLYLAERSAAGEPWTVDHIVTLGAGENGNGVRTQTSPWPSDPPAYREAADIGDGSVITFRSKQNLVPGRFTGGEAQVYVYERARDQVSCVSCPLAGVDFVGEASQLPRMSLPGLDRLTSSVNEQSILSSMRRPRSISTNGHVFFQTATPLVAADANTVIDVYEWRGGEVRLISAGSSAQDSIWGDASADGNTVFFRSNDDLVPGDHASGVGRVYAARIGGGYSLPSPDPECRGSECRPAGSPSPAWRDPATSAPRKDVSTLPEGSASRNCRPLAQRKRRAARRAIRVNQRVKVVSKRGHQTRRRVLVKRRKAEKRRLRQLNRRLNVCRRAGR